MCLQKLERTTNKNEKAAYFEIFTARVTLLVDTLIKNTLENRNESNEENYIRLSKRYCRLTRTAMKMRNWSNKMTVVRSGRNVNILIFTFLPDRLLLEGFAFVRKTVQMKNQIFFSFVSLFGLVSCT